MSSIDKKIQDFCQKYEAQVGESSRRIRRYRLSKVYEDLNNPIDYAPPQIDEPAMVQIDMPVDKFRTLVHMEDKLKEWKFDERLRGSKFVDYVNHIYEKEYREVSIREKYPAVQRAYEQYQILLGMTEAGEVK